MQLDNLDLTILKTLLTNRKHAIEFINENDPTIFSSDALRFGKLITDYVRTFKDLPTHRVLTDKVKANASLLEYVENVWKQIETTTYNQQDYPYDLQRMKNRF